MNKISCYTCRWWDDQHPRLKVEAMPEVDGIANPGICRKHKPGAYGLNNYLIGVQPIMDAGDFCGEHKMGEAA